MTDFFICLIKPPQCTDKYSKKQNFDRDFPSPCFDVPKTGNFTSGGVQNRKTKNRRLGTIVTSSQDFKLREKQISPTFSYFLINNALLYHSLVNWLAHNKKMTEKSVFLRSLKSWNDVTIIPRLLFLVSRLCTPPEINFTFLIHQNTGKENRYRKFFFAILISALRRFNRANKINLSYTL